MCVSGQLLRCLGGPILHLLVFNPRTADPSLTNVTQHRSCIISNRTTITRPPTRANYSLKLNTHSVYDASAALGWRCVAHSPPQLADVSQKRAPLFIRANDIAALFKSMHHINGTMEHLKANLKVLSDILII